MTASAGLGVLRRLASPSRLGLGWAGAALLVGAGAWVMDDARVAALIWAAGIVPVLALLVVEIARSLLKGEAGVDIIAALSMLGALLLGEHLAGVVVALMLAGGNVLEEVAERRATRELTALLDRTPRVAHRERDGVLEDVPVEAIQPGDRLLVKGGEQVPVDGDVEAHAGAARRVGADRRGAAGRAGGGRADRQRHDLGRAALLPARRRPPPVPAPMPASCGWWRRHRPRKRPSSGSPTAGP